MATTDENAADAAAECFVVSPIGAQGSEIRRRADNVLNYVIRPAASPIGLTVRRADQIDAPGSITSQIIQRLLDAEAVVVDLTDRNPNVYYELAIRDSFKLPVVLMAEEGTALASDIVGQRTIYVDSRDLESVARAIPRITQALRDALANPAAASPVQAAAQLGALSTGDAEQRVVAELVQEVSRLRRDVDATRHSLPADEILVEELELGVRTYNRLKGAGIQTAGGLTRLTEAELRTILKDEARSMEDVLLALNRRGFPLTW